MGYERKKGRDKRVNRELLLKRRRRFSIVYNGKAGRCDVESLGVLKIVYRKEIKCK